MYRHQRTRRAFLLAGVAGPGVAAVLAGCSASATRTSPATPADTPAASPVRLEFWLPGRQPDADALEPFHRQFAEEQHGAASVAVQLVTNEDMMERLTAALAAGNPPDAARLKEYRLADLGARNVLRPLDDLVAKDPDVRLRDFTAQSVEGSRLAPRTGSGTPASGGARTAPLLGLPDSHQLVVLFWNQDLVARAGLDPAAPPATWNNLRRAARAIAELPAISAADPGSASGTGAQAAAAKTWGLQFYEFSLREQTYCWFMEWIWRASGEVWADGGKDRTRATLDTPAALRALQFQVDLLHTDRSAVPAGTPVPELIANVPQGRVGYWMTTANQALAYDRAAPGLRFGVGPMPSEQRDAHQLQHNALSIFQASRAADVAYRLISFRSRAEVQARWAADGAWLPVRPALWQRPPFKDDARWQALAALVHRPGNRTKPVVPEWDAFTAALLPSLLAAWRAELAPRAALAAAETAANVQLAKLGDK